MSEDQTFSAETDRKLGHYTVKYLISASNHNYVFTGNMKKSTLIRPVILKISPKSKAVKIIKKHMGLERSPRGTSTEMIDVFDVKASVLLSLLDQNQEDFDISVDTPFQALIFLNINGQHIIEKTHFEHGPPTVASNEIRGQVYEQTGAIWFKSSLSNWVTPQIKFNIINGLAKTLLIMHQNGQVHSDLKPQNFLYNIQSHSVHLLDPGEQGTFGSPGWQSEEQIQAAMGQDKKITYRTDCHALGLLIIRLFETELDYPNAKKIKRLGKDLLKNNDLRSFIDELEHLQHIEKVRKEKIKYLSLFILTFIITLIGWFNFAPVNDSKLIEYKDTFNHLLSDYQSHNISLGDFKQRSREIVATYPPITEEILYDFIQTVPCNISPDFLNKYNIQKPQIVMRLNDKVYLFVGNTLFQFGDCISANEFLINVTSDTILIGNSFNTKIIRHNSNFPGTRVAMFEGLENNFAVFRSTPLIYYSHVFSDRLDKSFFVPKRNLVINGIIHGEEETDIYERLLFEIGGDELAKLDYSDYINYFNHLPEKLYIIDIFPGEIRTNPPRTIGGFIEFYLIKLGQIEVIGSTEALRKKPFKLIEAEEPLPLRTYTEIVLNSEGYALQYSFSEGQQVYKISAK